MREAAQLELVKALASLLDNKAPSFLGDTKDVMRDVASLLELITGGAESDGTMTGPLADDPEFTAFRSLVEGIKWR